MAKGSNPSARRPRKKHTSINFKTPREKKQLKLKRNLPDSVTPANFSKHINDDPLPLASTSNMDKTKRTVSTPSKTQLPNSNSVNSSQEEKEREKTAANATPVNSADIFQSLSLPPSTNDKVMLLIVCLRANDFLLCSPSVIWLI